MDNIEEYEIDWTFDKHMQAKREHRELRGGPEREDLTSNVRTYLVTIKCNKARYVSKVMLDKQLRLLVNKLTGCKADWSCIVGYEEDSVHRMHLHTIVKCTKQPYFKKYQIPSWTIHFQLVNDSKNALKYILKNDQNPYAIEQLFTLNEYYYGKNSFLTEEINVNVKGDGELLRCGATAPQNVRSSPSPSSFI